MKKIIYLILVIGLVFNACEPLDDIYNEIDAQEPEDPRNFVGTDSYTLTSDDYDTLGLNYGSFNSEDDAKSMIPDILSSIPKYDYWVKNSSVLVGYKLYIGNAFSVKEYSLKQEDYALSGSDLLGFKSDVTPSNYLDDILADNAGFAKEGDYRVAKYFQFTGDAYTVTPTVSLEENFDYGTTTGDLTTASGGVWVSHSGTPNQLMYDTTSLSMENYPSSDVAGSLMLDAAGSEDVSTFISAPVTSGTMYASTLINLSVVGDGTYSFHFADDSYGYTARVGAKTDGNGGVLFGIGATSSTLTYGTTSFALNTTYLLVSSYNIDNGIANLYILTSAKTSEPDVPEATNTGDAGKTIERIALRQGYGGPTATLDGIRVANTWSALMSNDQLDDIVIGDKVVKEMGYAYVDGAWVTAPDRFYLISDADFDSMGEESGQPGRYNNFGSSTPPDDYLPTFLDLKFPYAQEGEELDVVYDYYSSSSGAQVRGNLYTKTNGVWIAHQSTISTTLQFGNDGSKWMPDNTIKYVLTTADYNLLGEEYGSPGYYDNFDVREGTDNYESPESILAHINTILFKNYPNAEEGQKFAVSYSVYSGKAEVWEMNVVLSGGAYILQ